MNPRTAPIDFLVNPLAAPGAMADLRSATASPAKTREDFGEKFMCLTEDQIGLLRVNRERYAYPPVALTGELRRMVHCEFDTVSELEAYLGGLLGSALPHEVILGYLSVIYWGHYSGQQNRIRAERAFSRAKMAYQGTERRRIRNVVAIGEEGPVRVIREAQALIAEGEYGEAAASMSRNLPGVAFSFASKIAAFLDPARCGVIDSVLVEKYPDLGFALQNGYVADRAASRVAYSSYCRWLQEIACSLNRAGCEARWRENGVPRLWRAVDVERALFAGPQMDLSYPH